MLRLGQMRHRVLIKFKKGVTDPGGGRSEALGTYAERWAAVEDLGGSSSVLAQVLQASGSHKVTLRYDPDITAAMIVEIPGGAQLRIESVEDTGLAHVQTVLICSSYKDGAGGK